MKPRNTVDASFSIVLSIGVVYVESGEGYVPNVVALQVDENLEPWLEAMWMMMMVAETINTKRSRDWQAEQNVLGGHTTMSFPT